MDDKAINTVGKLGYLHGYPSSCIETDSDQWPGVETELPRVIREILPGLWADTVIVIQKHATTPRSFAESWYPQADEPMEGDMVLERPKGRLARCWRRGVRFRGGNKRSQNVDSLWDHTWN